MNWNALIRRVHRWLSIAFTLAVVVNLLAMGKDPSLWIGLLALVPLVFLLLTGLYLFVLPYAGRWRGAGRADP
jgi:PepSY-associated TM helix.